MNKNKNLNENENKDLGNETNSESLNEELSNDDSGDINEAKIAELEIQLKELQDKLLRKAAEFENYKRRTENDQFNLITYAAESFIIKLLPIVDDFERSMAHIDDMEGNKSVRDGIKLVYDKLQKLLNEQGVKKMQAKGEPFNVNQHDALMQRKDDSVPPHTVLEEIEPGYIYRDKVIRHAKVIVSEESTEENAQNPNRTSNDPTTENEN